VTTGLCCLLLWIIFAPSTFPQPQQLQAVIIRQRRSGAHSPHKPPWPPPGEVTTTMPLAGTISIQAPHHIGSTHYKAGSTSLPINREQASGRYCPREKFSQMPRPLNYQPKAHINTEVVLHLQLYSLPKKDRLQSTTTLYLHKEATYPAAC